MPARSPPREETFQWKVSSSGDRRIPGRGRLGRRPRLGAEREQPLEDGQRAADVDRARIEEPLDLQAVRRGDDQRGGIGRVDVRRDAAGLLPSLDPGGQQLAQRAEPAANELPGDDVLFLQGVGAEGRVELDQAGDRPVPLGGLDYLADGGLAYRVRLAGGPGLVRPVGLNQEFVARREGTPRSPRRSSAATPGPPRAARTARSRCPESAAGVARLSGTSGALAGLRWCRSPRHRKSRLGRAAAAGAGRG